MIHSRLFQQFIYWGVWLIIPLIWEVLTGLFSCIAVLVKYCMDKRKEKLGLYSRELDFYPKVSILIPVYNSSETLEMCLQSVCDQDYPVENLEVILIDNGSRDNSYEIFARFQAEHPQLKLWWYRSEQGKSKALNKGIFGSSGKYIINIDSDGRLDKGAVKSVVSRFEKDEEIACITGVVLTDPMLIEKTEGGFLKTIQLCELFEYCESFLVGRNFQAVLNTMYTMAGAFSCFRRESLLKTQMYNSETIGEDTHMTFQIKSFVGGKIAICEDAFFYVDPVESFDRIYTQRQRWQRAELEVAKLFTSYHIGGFVSFITKPAVRKLVSDHTLVFPRLLWLFAMIYLYFINYPLNLLIGANTLLYLSYLLNSFLYLLVGSLYLKKQKPIRKYVFKHWYICIVMPFYRFIIYWVRIAGIVNSLKTKSRWRTKTFSEEVGAVRRSIVSEIKTRLHIDAVKKFIEN